MKAMVTPTDPSAPPASEAPATPHKDGDPAGPWRNKRQGGQLLVLRRDSGVPDWFVLGALDPHAPAALRAYAASAKASGENAEYCADLVELADEFEAFLKGCGKGDPSAVPHRKDDPSVVARMVAEGKGP